MNHQFNPGDLALIVSCWMVPQMVGRCVTLIESVKRGGISNSYGGPWRNDGSEVAWVVEGDGLVSRTALGDFLPYPRALIDARSLMPLRGDLEPEQQKAKEAEPCA
ncbi:hypothetical protein C1S65_16655 [Pseudomonas putida]|uniref:Uncharacterized protein n=1 Tax=Pseudomonas putida TaxID=303 RepID=A0AAD0LB98_PSEPU|nr:hypothetical protein C1S65_16655 [Pseudomonas putida]